MAILVIVMMFAFVRPHRGLPEATIAVTGMPDRGAISWTEVGHQIATMEPHRPPGQYCLPATASLQSHQLADGSGDDQNSPSNDFTAITTIPWLLSINNLPAVLVLIPFVFSAGWVAVLTMLIGVNIGPNLSCAGLLATLLWRRIIGAHDRPARQVYSPRRTHGPRKHPRLGMHDMSNERVSEWDCG